MFILATFYLRLSFPWKEKKKRKLHVTAIGWHEVKRRGEKPIGDRPRRDVVLVSHRCICRYMRRRCTTSRSAAAARVLFLAQFLTIFYCERTALDLSVISLRLAAPDFLPHSPRRTFLPVFLSELARSILSREQRSFKSE